MANIIVFGAGGRAGRPTVAAATRQGHKVTAVVRDPAKYPDLAADGVTVVAGDVTDAASVAKLAPGHDAVVNAAASLDEGHFVAAAEALVEGLTGTGVSRLVAVGIGGALEVEPGVPAYDSDQIPEEARAFSRGHAAQLPVLRASDLDWVVLAPPLVYLDEGAGTGGYRLGTTAAIPGADAFAYADLALALVAEATVPTRSREMVAVAGAG